MAIERWMVAGVVVSAGLAATVLVMGLVLSLYSSMKLQIEEQAEASFALLLIYLPMRQFWYGVALLALLAALFAWLLTASWHWALLITLATMAALPFLRNLMQRRRTACIEQQLPEALRLLANALQAGMSLAPALALTAEQLSPPLATELLLIVQRQRTGEALANAFTDFHQRTRSSMVQFFGFVVVTSARHGGQQANVLSRMAVAIQQQHYAQQRILSLSAQARLQARVMFFLPVGLFFALKWVHQDSTTQLLATRGGQLVLLVCGCLMALGFFLTRKILGQFNVDD